MNNTTNKLSLQHPDTIDDTPPPTPPPTPVLNPKLLNTKHLSVDIHTWNDFHETNNQIPTMDVSPIYANNPHFKRNISKTNDLSFWYRYSNFRECSTKCPTSYSIRRSNSKD